MWQFLDTQGRQDVVAMLEQLYQHAPDTSQGFGMRTLPWNRDGGPWRVTALEQLSKVRLSVLARRLVAAKSTSNFLAVLERHGFGQALFLNEFVRVVQMFKPQCSNAHLSSCILLL